jgi:hypothetical protein
MAPVAALIVNGPVDLYVPPLNAPVPESVTVLAAASDVQNGAPA